MRWPKNLAVTGLMILLLLIIAGPRAAAVAPAQTGDHLTVAGIIADAQGKGVKEGEIELLVNGQKIPPQGREGHLESSGQGSFVGRYLLPPGTLPDARVQIRAVKPSWQAGESDALKVLAAGTDAAGNWIFQAQADLTLKRQVTPAFWIAAAVLLLVYILIAAEWLHRTLAAFLGAAFILFISYTVGTFNKNYFILSFEDAMRGIDLNVIFLLMGMMIVVGVLKKTGLFQWLAYKSYALARGNIFILSLILQVVTAVTSAFLDNVTTMLLLIPVTIEIAVTLKINPLALLIPEVFASNVGGTATLIGDPPNILIGSYAKLTFGQFVSNLTLSPSIAPPVIGLVGSTASTATLRPSAWHSGMSLPTSELLPAPPGPVNPTVRALPVRPKISLIIWRDSGSWLSTIVMALAMERLSPSMRPFTIESTGCYGVRYYIN